METDTPTPPRRTPRWIKITLVLSLAANLLIAGMVVGAVLSRGGKPDVLRAAQDAREIGAGPFVGALDADDRRALLRDLRDRADTLRQTREDLKARLELLLVTLRAPDFDANAFAAILAEQRGVAVSRQEFGERLLVARLSQMSATDRAAFADRLERSFRRRRH